MSEASEGVVVDRGRIILPADLRTRWGIVDLGDAALVVPGGLSAAGAELRRVIKATYEDGIAALDDPDLADQ